MSDRSAVVNAIRPSGDADGLENAVESEFGEIDAGAREVKKMLDPKKPRADEIEEHCITHLPFRNWCSHCISGRGVGAPHYAGKGDSGMSEMHMDFMFIGQEGEPGVTVPVLVVRERSTRMTMAAVVPTKSTGTFVAKRVLAFMHEVGIAYGDLVVKSDQEPAIKSIINEVGRMRAASGCSGRYIDEDSPVGSSASNGVIERAVQSVQGMTRVLKSAVEERWKASIPTKHPVITWLVEYSAFLLNRFEVSSDGKTSYERCKGKYAKTLGLEFGETLMWRRKPAGGALGKLTSLWGTGMFLGIRGKSGEIIVGDASGVWKTRTVRRVPIEDRWPTAAIDCVVGVPWNTCEGDTKADGEVPKVIKMTEPEAAHERARTEVPIPTRFAINKDDLEKHGYTAKCHGCVAALRGGTKQKHSEECRKRMTEEMRDDEKVKKSQRKIDKFIEEALQNEDQQRTKKARVTEAEVTPAASPGSPVEGAGVASGSGISPEERKRQLDEAEEERGASRRRLEDNKGEKRGLDESQEEPGPAAKEQKTLVGILEVHQEPDEENFEGARDDAGEASESCESFFDEKTSKRLDPKLVREAMDEELTFMQKIPVFELAPIAECWEKTGKAPISTRFVNTNKGTDESPEIRCRLVARHFKPKGERDRYDLFASMPPFEAKKLLFAKAASQKPVWRSGRMRLKKVMLIDVKKAHLNGVLGEGEFAYIELPKGAGAPGQCGRLRRWLYGMRPAASAWEKDYSERLEGIGLVRGKAAPTAFFHSVWSCSCVVHGDDFTFLGYEEDLAQIVKAMKGWYELKVRGILGDGPGDVDKIKILNREVRFISGSLEMEADRKYAKLIAEECGLGHESTGLSMPIVKEDEPEDGCDDALESAASTKFRALAATANFLAMDRADVQFAAKEICRDMSNPTGRSQKRLKRLARYLLDHPRLIWSYGPCDEEDSNVLRTFSDSDWAGCKRTRKSTSGGAIAVGGGVLKSWSSTQNTIARSSGEAEYYALVKAAAEALGVQAVAKDLGWDMSIQIWVDSSAAKGIASRVGLGKLRHMEVSYLWVQQALRQNKFELKKILGLVNPADILTKPMSAADMTGKLATIGGRIERREKPSMLRKSWADITEEEFDGAI
jgi:hypothetical protein